MKRIIVAVLFLTLVAGSVFAQNLVEPVIRIGAGLSIPASPDLFSDGWSLGFGGLLEAGVGY